MAREARPGKLRPISTLAKARTQHKSVRHGDQYSILPSPVKPDSISHVLVSSQVQSNPFEHNISGFANTSGIPSVPPSCTVHGDATSDGKHNLPGSEAAERPGRLIATSPSNTVRRRSSRTSKRQLLGDGLTRNAGRSSRTETINAARRQPRGQRSAGRKNRLEEHISEDREIDTEILGASNEAGQTSTMTKSTNILSSAEDDLQRSDEANAQHEMHKTAELDHAHSKELAFEFNHVPKRPGRCQTDIGKALVRGCSNARVLARDPEISYESLVQTIEDLCKQLKLTIADVQSSERGLFKGDAYMYIFGALYLFVESIHQRLGCMPESSTWPVTATHVLQRLTGEILSLEDHIASWRVNLRQQHKGDPFIQHARSNIIKPLRQMNASLRRRIDQLEISALNEDYLTKLRHSRKRKEENDIDRARDAAYKVERWKWWQNLHISRMECEPCIERRKGLSIMTLGELEEKDANGHPIERVPIFKLRPTITPQWLSAIGQTQEWTRDAELALLGGLEKFAGNFPYFWFCS